MPGLPSKRFVNAFNAKADEFPGGTELLQRLKQKACGLDFIFIFLELHCAARGAQILSPTQESIIAYRAGEHSQADYLDDLAGRLTIMSNEVEATNKQIAGWLARHGQKPFVLPDEIHSYVSLVQAISKELRDVSLRTAPMDALNLLADCMIVKQSDRASMVKELEKQPNKARASAIAQAGAAQARHIKRSIAKTDYKDLALLLEIGYAAYGVEKPMEAGAVRKLVKRARDRRVKKAKQPPLKPVYARDFGGRKVS